MSKRARGASASEASRTESPASAEDSAKKGNKKQKLAASPYAGPAEFKVGQHIACAKLADVVVSPRSSTTVRIICWNVNGFRAMVKREGADALLAYLGREDADILALQEVKLDEATSKDASNVLRAMYPHSDFSLSSKAGYAGVATFSKVAPSTVSKDLPGLGEEQRGRLLTSTWTAAPLSGLCVCNVYVPNSGMKLERLDARTGTWDPALRGHMAATVAAHPLTLLLGDLNVAFHDMDVHAPGSNRNKTPGFCDGEREGMAALLGGEAGLKDIWRDDNPGTQQFTYWSARFNCRAQNKGWRLDYALAAPALVSRGMTVSVRADFPGVDHVPIVVDIA